MSCTERAFYVKSYFMDFWSEKALLSNENFPTMFEYALRFERVAIKATKVNSGFINHAYNRVFKKSNG